jgi:hypothetical protein
VVSEAGLLNSVSEFEDRQLCRTTTGCGQSRLHPDTAHDGSFVSGEWPLDRILSYADRRTGRPNGKRQVTSGGKTHYASKLAVATHHLFH